MITIRDEIAADIPAREALLDRCLGERRTAKSSERLREGRHWEAIGLLEGLAEVTTGLLRERARLRLAEAYARNPRAGKSAEHELATVITENPRSVEARLALARLYHDRGLRSRATELVRQVLELDPASQDAREIERALDGKPADGRPSWRRWLGLPS